ncbi:MAG: HPr family phosphocarrier protein [Candidatus Omnitrophica bacterium]|jgi:phosphotransferase system HPr (HPr) family protein|nr:HPr family phosphocarrier protein [Candidatus Omnitrophota bacterium]
MIAEKKITIRNKSGLHARPAAVFVQVANKYDSEVIVKKGKLEVNGKSIMGILMLAAGKNSQVTMKIDGDDAEQAMAELEQVLSGDLDAPEANKAR